MFGTKHVIVPEAHVGLVYADGRFVRVAGPGRHRLVSLPWERQEITTVDMRRRAVSLSGQEMLTSDALSVRLNVAAEFRVIDAPRALHTVESYEAALYTLLQIILRDEVQARTLDTLLAERGALGAVLLARGQAEAPALGLELVTVGVRDIILPGEIKRMLSQEVEALRAGRAALVAAREETAATRAKANTARLLSDSPVLLRLREIEALAKVGDGAGNTVVVAVPSEFMMAMKTVGALTAAKEETSDG